MNIINEQSALPNQMENNSMEVLTPIVVGIGASAGGLEALTEFFQTMPSDTGMAFVIIQHMEPNHESHMAEILTKETAMTVVQAEDGMQVEPNKIYTNPPGRAMRISKGQLVLDMPVERQHIRSAIDHFLVSLAEDLHEKAIAIILSGSNGMDGPRGIRAIRANGGMCIAQNPQSAQFSEMPQAVIDTGLIDNVLDIEKMPGVLVEFAKFPQSPASDDEKPPTNDEELEAIITLLRIGTKNDYSYYKRATLMRRSQRRMGLRQISSMGEYLKLLKSDSNELIQLGKDMLIGVSSFFRDPHAYEELQSIINNTLRDENRDPDAPLRAWVAGCATGEEAYSIAMVLLEATAESGRYGRVQVFASDVDDTALDTARAGIYPDGIAGSVSPERLKKFFTKQKQTYQVVQYLRESVVFSRQNLLNDPPFSRLDLISCRNVLIYLEHLAHKRVLAMFSYALNLGGFLFLGKSEGVNGLEEYFEQITKQNHIYRLTQTNRRGVADFPLFDDSSTRIAIKRERTHFDTSTLSQVNQDALLRHFDASLVLIDAQGKILYFHGQTERYLGHPKGLASLNILDLMEGSLSVRLRRAINQALQQDEPVTFMAMSLSREDAPIARLTVRQIPANPVSGKILSVIFEDAHQQTSPAPVQIEDEPLVAQLETEVKILRQELNANAEAYNEASDELKAAHEEVMSMNEEFQSANEELEASKEELQSLNEELSTVNSQLYYKINDLTDLNNDLANLLSATEIATVFLDNKLRIKRYTPSVIKLLNLIDTDIGRPLSHITLNIPDIDLTSYVRSVLKSLVPIEMEVITNEGHWYTLHILPYRTQDNRIDGAVITFTDVMRLKQVEQNLQFQKTYVEKIVDTVRHPLIVLDGKLQIISVNPAFCQMFHLDRHQTQGKWIFDLDNQQWDIPHLRELLDQVISTESDLEEICIDQMFSEIGHRILLMSAHRIQQAENKSERILLAIEDITEREKARQALEKLAGNRLEKIQELVIQMAHSEQRERERLACVLHDNLQQLLVSAKYQMRKMRSQTKDEKLLKSIQTGEDLLNQMLITSRSLISDLSPSILYEAGLEAALPWLARKMEVEHGLIVETEINAKVSNDDDAVVVILFQAVRELLLNIVKHAGVETARVQLDLLENHKVRIIVQDEGAGFDQDSAKSNLSSATGLGLFGLIERLEYIGGQCMIESQPGKGTKVTLTALLNPTRHKKRKSDQYATIKESGYIPQVESPDSDDKKIRVLLVDDHQMVREGLAGLLAQEKDIEIVAEASNGEQAVELARQLSPDVVIMDVVMPEMNGVEATRIIADELPNTRIIGLSMYIEADRAEAMLEAGAKDYLTKGGPTDDLIAAIRRQYTIQ